MKLRGMVMGACLSGVVALSSPAMGNTPKPGEPSMTCNAAAHTVTFRRSSAKLDSAAKEALDEVAAWLREDDARQTQVEAYADLGGETSNTTRLSRRRAEAVETYLKRKGIDPQRIATFSRGGAVAPGADPTTGNRVAVLATCEPAAPKPSTAEAPPPEPAPAEAPAPPAEAPPAETAPPTTQPPAMPSAEGVHARGEEPKPVSGLGMAVTAGGGVTGFFNTGSRNIADPGFTWDVRVTIGTRTVVGLDLAYLGSVQNVDATGLGGSTSLVGNGAEADLRLQVPQGMFRPYAFGGIGWTHYSVQKTDLGVSGLLGGDDVGTVPFGVGLAIGHVNGITFDLRAATRLAFDDQLFDGVPEAQGSSSLTSWGVTARLGGEF